MYICNCECLINIRAKTVSMMWPQGQALCSAGHLREALLHCLRTIVPAGVAGNTGNSLLLRWCCLALGKLADDQLEVRSRLGRKQP